MIEHSHEGQRIDSRRPPTVRHSECPTILVILPSRDGNGIRNGVRFWEQNGSGGTLLGAARRGHRAPLDVSDVRERRMTRALPGGALGSHRGGQGFKSPQLHREVFTFQWGLFSRLGLTIRRAGWRGGAAAVLRALRVWAVTLRVARLVRGHAGIAAVAGPGAFGRVPWVLPAAVAGCAGLPMAARRRAWRGSCGGGAGFWAGVRRLRGAGFLPGGCSRRAGCAGCG